ncbi:MAG: PKD domain-containing protein [Candidatus Micrarchaeota archaeon]|nr:PKD domain-containing protein [Candidatus Micrarchaeota archaeon]
MKNTKIAAYIIFIVALIAMAGGVNAYGSARPVAVLSADSVTVCSGNPVRFYGGASYDPDGEITQYIYEYGDGTDSGWVIGLDWTYHTYHSPGTFYAKLRVRDNSLDISDYSNIVQINVISCSSSDHYPVITSMSLTPDYPYPNDDLHCSASFSDIDNDLSHAIFRWYRNGGIVREDTVSLCDGCSNGESMLPRTATQAGDTVSCEVTVYDYNSKTTTESRTINIRYIDSKPVAVLNADNNDICIGDYVRFDGSDSYDSDGNILQYHYDFGDGTTSPWISESARAYHKYTREGIFYARLKVKDDRYQESDWSNAVRITVRGDCNYRNNRPDISRMGISPSAPTTTDDIECTVDAIDSDADLSRIEFVWIVNGRTVATRTKNAYGSSLSERDNLGSVYTNYGDTVTCRVVVYDSRLNSDSMERSVTIESYTNARPVAVLNIDKNNICVGETVRLDASGSMDPDGFIRFYKFETGDGKMIGWGSDKIVHYTYSTAGTYTVRLGVRDNSDLENYATAVVHVSDEGSCAVQQDVCGVQITDFDFLASGKTGNKLWAKATVKNTGNVAEDVDIYLYLDDVLEDQYKMTLRPSTREARKFYFRVPESGTKNIRIAAYADCGSSDEKQGTITVEEGFVPEPAPAPDPLRVNIYPKTVDLMACEGRSITIEMTSPDRREFSVRVEGMNDEWLEYPSSVIVDGSKKSYIYVNPLEAGRYNLSVVVATGNRVFVHKINVHVMKDGSSENESLQKDTDGLAGMFTGTAGNILIGVLIVIIFLIIIFALFRNVKNDEKTTYIKREYEQRPQREYNMQYRY